MQLLIKPDCLWAMFIEFICAHCKPLQRTLDIISIEFSSCVFYSICQQLADDPEFEETLTETGSGHTVFAIVSRILTPKT